MPTRHLGHLTAVSLILAVSASACAESPTRPPVTDVRLSLSVEPTFGGPSQPVAITIKVLNAGETPVWRCEGCGCTDGFIVLGPDGARVSLRPWSPPPACPDHLVSFEPGREFGGTAQFNGTLYVVDAFPSPAYDAPPGTYTVIATFAYQTSLTDDGTLLKRELKFDWRP